MSDGQVTQQAKPADKNHHSNGLKRVRSRGEKSCRWLTLSHKERNVTSQKFQTTQRHATVLCPARSQGLKARRASRRPLSLGLMAKQWTTLPRPGDTRLQKVLTNKKTFCGMSRL